MTGTGLLAPRFHRLPAWAGLIVAAGLAGSCAVGPQLTELTPWSPPTGQSCTVSGPQGSLDLLVDSAALASRIEAMGLRDGTLLLSVRADSGEVEWVRQIERILPRRSARQLEALVREMIRAPADTVAAGRLVIRTAGGVVESLELGPSETCRPVLANPDELAEELQEAYQTIRMLGTARLQMFVDSTGRVTEVKLERSSGKPEVDNASAFAARLARFHPAIVDRHPVGAWVSLAFTLREDRPTASRWIP